LIKLMDQVQKLQIYLIKWYRLRTPPPPLSSSTDLNAAEPAHKTHLQDRAAHQCFSRTPAAHPPVPRATSLQTLLPPCLSPQLHLRE
jgi:hypothetical protein